MNVSSLSQDCARPGAQPAPEPRDLDAMLDQVMRDVMDVLDRIDALVNASTHPNQTAT